MKKRHTDDELYFNELDKTCSNFYIPYLQDYLEVQRLNVLEIGCGQGGNLKQFYLRGCNVVGIDINENKINNAQQFFSRIAHDKANYKFECRNIYDMNGSEKYDLILVHDVIEHVHDKELLFLKANQMLAPNGILFFRFPPWQMPFGGHQQICISKICSSLPFLHLLPTSLYKGILKFLGEDKTTIAELLDIRQCRITIEQFESIASKDFDIIDRTLWFINPHYQIKFGVKPVKLNRFLYQIRYLRNFVTTSCFYLLKKRN